MDGTVGEDIDLSLTILITLLLCVTSTILLQCDIRSGERVDTLDREGWG